MKQETGKTDYLDTKSLCWSTTRILPPRLLKDLEPNTVQMTNSSTRPSVPTVRWYSVYFKIGRSWYRIGRSGISWPRHTLIVVSEIHTLSVDFENGSFMNFIKKTNRKVKGMLQSLTAANHRHKEEEKKANHTHCKTSKCTRNTKTSFLIPKRGYQNAKINTETRTRNRSI